MPRARRILALILLLLVMLVALLVAAVGMLDVIGCCAIDERRFPEQAARNRERQRTASLVTMAALAAAAGAGIGAVRTGNGLRRLAAPRP